MTRVGQFRKHINHVIREGGPLTCQLRAKAQKARLKLQNMQHVSIFPLVLAMKHCPSNDVEIYEKVVGSPVLFFFQSLIHNLLLLV